MGDRHGGAAPRHRLIVGRAGSGAWFRGLGAALVDGGNPSAASRTVHPDVLSAPGGGGLTGYSVVDATDVAAAADLAKGCPLLADGGTVEVYETVPM